SSATTSRCAASRSCWRPRNEAVAPYRHPLPVTRAELDDDVVARIEMRPRAGRNDAGRVVLLDDQRSGARRRREIRAAHYGRLQPTVGRAEVRWPWGRRRGLAPARAHLCGNRGALAQPLAHDLDGYQLDRFFRSGAVPVRFFVLHAERFFQALD